MSRTTGVCSLSATAGEEGSIAQSWATGVLCLYRAAGTALWQLLTLMPCRYEGEFYGGFASGLGEYTRPGQYTYYGQWHAGQRTG